MKILVKYPTRERFFQFQFILTEAFRLSSERENIHYLVSYDEDDKNFNLERAQSLLPEQHITFIKGKSENKIHACNRDMDKITDWDIVMLLSDDMVCKQEGWDYYIREAFAEKDRCVHFYDGYRDELMTLALMDKAYYNRDKYIYNPAYKSLFADNEMMEVAKLRGRYFYENRILFKHEHYSNSRRVRPDALMRRTESFYKEDEATYLKRKETNFGL